MTAIDMVNHPPHYSGHPSGVECIALTRDMGFSVGNAVKYVWRGDLKNGRQDLEKAQWYLRDAINNDARVHIGNDEYTWRRLIDRVSEAETDPDRFMFFRAIRHLNLHKALGLVGVLLARADDEVTP